VVTFNHIVEMIAGVTLLVLVLENPTLPLRIVNLITAQLKGVASLAHPPTGG
jgi:hypothetical protein